MQNLADRLLDAIDKKRNPSCVGLDPDPEKIPEHIKKRALREHGDTLDAVASAIVDFNTLIIDAVADVVAVVKPQIAFYEKFGAPGIQAFLRTIDYAHEHGLLVITDGKRNDVDNTAKAYAEAHLGQTKLLSGRSVPVFNADALTVNGYLGSGGIKPFTEVCQTQGKGIFVLAKTSNTSSGELQDLVVEGKGEVYVVMAELVKEWGKEFIGTRGYSSIGMVVGATFPEQALRLREVAPQALFLVPGYGAQGGGAKGVVPCFNPDGYGAVVNSSRGIIFAYLEKKYKDLYKPTEFHAAAREAACDMNRDIVNALQDGGKLPKNWK